MCDLLWGVGEPADLRCWWCACWTTILGGAPLGSPLRRHRRFVPKAFPKVVREVELQPAGNPSSNQAAQEGAIQVSEANEGGTTCFRHVLLSPPSSLQSHVSERGGRQCPAVSKSSLSAVGVRRQCQMGRSWSCASVKQSSFELPQTFAEAQAVSSTDDEKLDFRGNFSRKTRCWQRPFKIPDEKVIIHDESTVRLRPLRRFQSRPPPTGNSCTSGGVHWEMVLPHSLHRNQRPLASEESDATTLRPLATARRASQRPRALRARC